MNDPIHALYYHAISCDEHYSKVLAEHGASRWESVAVRSARSARVQHLIKVAYQAKVEADIDYHNACNAQRVGY